MLDQLCAWRTTEIAWSSCGTLFGRASDIPCDRDKGLVLPPGPREKSRFHVTEPITTGFGMEECGFSRNSLYM